MAHEAHPIHLSSVCVANGYPFLFTSFWARLIIFTGHAATHKPHPLQRSVSTTIAPLIVAIKITLLVVHILIIEL